VRLFSFLIDKARVKAEIDLDGERRPVAMPEVPTLEPEGRATEEPALPVFRSEHRVPLIALARGRSGDKGNHSNIGILAREHRFVPFIAAALTADAVAAHLAHLLDPENGCVTRYSLPSCDGWNFLLENSLGGGGVASLRADPQGKAHAQQLLAFEVPVPKAIFDELHAKGTA